MAHLMWIITFVQTLASDAEFTSSLHPCPDFRNLQRRVYQSGFFFFRLLTSSKMRSCQNDGRSYFLLLLSGGKRDYGGLEEAAWQFFQIKRKFGEFLNIMENMRQYKKIFFHRGRISIETTDLQNSPFPARSRVNSELW